MQKVLNYFLYFLLFLLLVLTVLSFLGAFHFTLEFLSHSRPLFCLAAILLALSFFLRKSRRAALCAFVLILVNAVQLVNLYVPYGSRELGAAGTKIKLLQMNIWGGKNHSVHEVWDEIEREDADIVGISEITKNWWAFLQPRLKKYPFQVVQPSFGGICLLSKFPLKDASVEHFGAIKRPRVVAHAQVGGRWIKIVIAHPVIPMRNIGTRDAEFVQLAKDTATANGPVILAGDLNCTPFSYFFYKLLKDGNLHDSEKGFGYQPSWNAHFIVPLFAIDHCLVSPDIVTLKRFTGASVGSDHLPVVTELSVPTN